MTPTNHELGFRPSHFPALTECIHHQQKEGESEARERGNRTHSVIANVCKGSLLPLTLLTTIANKVGPSSPSNSE